MSNDSISEDLLKSLAVLSLEGMCSVLESSLQLWNILTLWMVKTILSFPCGYSYLGLFPRLAWSRAKRRVLFLWENQLEIPAGPELSDCNHPVFSKCATHAVGLLAVPEISVRWGLGKLEMKVLSPRPLSLEFALSRNMKLGHVKERYVSFLTFFQLFDAGNPRWFIWSSLHVIGLFFILFLSPAVSKRWESFFYCLEYFKFWGCKKGKFNNSCNNSRWSQQGVLPVWQKILDCCLIFEVLFSRKCFSTVENKHLVLQYIQTFMKREGDKHLFCLSNCWWFSKLFS